jgi:hypothetical protein
MKKIIPFLGLAVILALFACNKERTHLMDGKAYANDPGKSSATPKVLVLVIDGARGQTLRSMRPPVIWSMRDSAVFSWDGVSDTSGANGAGWADMLTGVTSAQHGVNGDDYTNKNLATYPVFTQYLKAAGVVSRSTAFCASAVLSQQLIGNSMDVNKVLTTDVDVTTAVVDELKNDSAALVFAEFSGVDAAGKQYGYDESISQYSSAILDADNNVGNIITALRGRKNFANENWLVVVTSNHGGYWPVPLEDQDGTPFSNPQQNSFTLFFNPRFQSEVVVRPENIRGPYEGKTVRLYGPSDKYVGAENADGTLYDIGSGSLTIEAKIKFNKGPHGDYTYSYPPFLGKIASRYGSTAGWAFFRNGKNIAFFVGDGSASKTVYPTVGISDGEWHSLSATATKVGSSYQLAVFIDGENKGSDYLMSSMPAIRSTSNTRMGYLPEVFSDEYIDMYISDVRIFNTVVSDENIKAWAPRTYITKFHPNYENLIGYWSCLDGKGGKFADRSKSQKDFSLRGNYTWTDFSNMSNYLFPQLSNAEKFVPNPCDIPMVIFNWMKVPVQTGWNLQGKGWSANYRDFPTTDK